MNKRKRGKQIEGKVASYLRSAGYQIIERNFTIRGGEIDIIAREQSELVFVEVKSLKNENYIRLEQTITSKKRQTLIKTCRVWMMRNEMQDADWRIDFVGVVASSGSIDKLKHIKNAIY
ncbi:MAG: YraN family protein [Candidatus Dojkabacteria bacterium]